ncbi:MAG: TonB-dependent receptor, partial [Betaproteobacteria bacterium]|nr:TonB-dependent receptor [Betaproteobacteria bacterium]
DAMTLDPRWTLYAGLRHTRLTRASQITDDPNTTRYDQQFTTPWAGVAYTAAPGVVAYASWGEGVETEVVPNRPTDFDNPGVALPALKSRQTEVGVKWLAHPRLLLSTALFDIHRPSADNLPGANGLLHRVAGARQAEHRGVEFTAAGKVTPQLDMRASAMWLAARITQSPDPTLLGQRPTDVPRVAASLFADYKVAALAGLSVNSLLTYTGSKAVTADNAVNLPAAWSMNAGASYATRIGNTPLTWRVQIDNLLDRRYWADAPTQSWGGIYLFPAPARTLSVSVQFDL